VALVLLFPALMFVPGMSSLLSIERAGAVAVAAVWVVLLLAASSAYRVGGLSWLYLALDLVESLGIQLGICLLVYRSGNAVSFLWFAYLAHVQMVASVGFSTRNLAVVAVGPVGLVLAFVLESNSASAWLSLLVGAMGCYIYSVMARVYSDLAQTCAREAHLKETLARLRVDEERARISRDLHDSVAGELSALAWRLRHTSVRAGESETPTEAVETEMRRLGERIRGALASLRAVVLDLRREQHSWGQMLVALRELCQDLCEGRKLVFEADDAPSALVPERMIDDVRCIVLELVRNATTHADPARIAVQIRVRDGLEISVSDDGCGLRREHATRASGGLANVRARTARLLGKLDIETAGPGTQIVITLPDVRDL
jgi:signal transduction histidine kinase